MQGCGASASASSRTSSSSSRSPPCASCRASTMAALDKGEGLPGILRRPALHVRPQGRALHRARQRVGSGRGDGRRTARLARRRLEEARTRRSRSSCLTQPAAVRPQARLGLDDQGRRQGGRSPNAVPETSPCSTAISTRSITTRPATFAHHAAKSLIFPLVAPGSQEEARGRLWWNADQP